MALFMCNTSNVKEMEIGRPQTVMFEGGEVKPNGSIVTLGNTVEKTKGRAYDHVHAVTFGEAEAVEGKFIIVAPEINVEEYRTIDGQIGKYVLEPGVTYSAYQLQKLDRIEYSDSYFTGAYFVSPEALKVGDTVKINAQGKFEKVVSNGALRVVSILPTHLPVMMAPGKKNQKISLMPQAGLKIKLEVVR